MINNLFRVRSGKAREIIYNEWKEKALAQLKSLIPEPYTKDEQEILDIQKETGDRFTWFMVFGITPNKKCYIDYTIKLIEELDPYSETFNVDVLIPLIRTKWCMRERWNIKS